MKRLYFAHSYQPNQRRFNERIWREFMKCGCATWVDRGLESGTGGRRYPMDVSFNEWMMSRCDGFVSVVPQGGSPYLDLELRLALRMGLPTLVFAAEGAAIKSGDADCEFPVFWKSFLSEKVRNEIRDRAEAFASRIETVRDSRGASKGSRRLSARTGEPRVALLPSSGPDEAWSAAHLTVSEPYAATLLNPANFRQPRDLINEIDKNHDLLVVDVADGGTPPEMLGYLEAHGIALVRVCRVQDAESEALPNELARKNPGPVRLPYMRMPEKDPGPVPATPSAPPRLPRLSRLTDGMQIDPGMRPVLFWSSATQLGDRVASLLQRIKGFRSGFEEEGQPADILTDQQAREYFAPPETAKSVFLSFAGAAAAPENARQKHALADQLARIFRFNDLHCFHYLDKESTEGRLESGELVNQGLEKRVDDADVVVILYDRAYRESEFCMNELRQALDLKERGLLTIRAYKLPGDSLDLEAFRGNNVYEHGGPWDDVSLSDIVVENVLADCAGSSASLRRSEVGIIESWMAAGGMTTGASVRRLLSRSGVRDDELDALGVHWNGGSASDCLAQVLKQPAAKTGRQRHRAIVTLLLDAFAANDEGRGRSVNRWIREHALVGPLPGTTVTFEQVLEVPDAVTPVDLRADRAISGQRIGQVLPAALHATTPLVLRADRRAAEIPVEWARENAPTEPVCVRRQIRWMLPYTDHRAPIVEDLSTRAMPPHCLLLALKGDHIDPEGEVNEVKTALDKVYAENDWPPEFVRVAVCDSANDVQAHLNGCSYEFVHVAGHMGGDALQVASEQIASEVVGQWLASSRVRLLVLNGCEGARAESPLALYSVAIADKIVQLGKVPEVVAHRIALTDRDGTAFAIDFARAFMKSFDASAACFQARRTGSPELRLSPVVISQRKPRTG